jgi:hypothetical protein
MKFTRFLIGIIFLLPLVVSNSAFAQYSYTGIDVYPAFPSGSTHNRVLLIDSTRNFTISENTTLNTLEVKVTDASFNTLHAVNLPSLGGGDIKVMEVRPDQTLYLCYRDTGSFFGDSLHLARIDTAGNILMQSSLLFSTLQGHQMGFTVTSQGDLLFLRTQSQSTDLLLLHIDANGNFISDNALPFSVNYQTFPQSYRNRNYEVDDLGFIYIKIDSVGEWGPFSFDYQMSRYLYKVAMDGSIVWQVSFPYTPTATDATFHDLDQMVLLGDTLMLMGETTYDTYADEGLSAKIQPTILFYDTSGTLIATYISQDSIIGNSNLVDNYCDYPLFYKGKSPSGDLIFTQQFVDNGTPIETNPKVIAINPQTMNLSFDFDLIHLYDPSLTYLNTVYTPGLVIFNYPPGELSCFANYELDFINTPYYEECVQFRLDASGNILYTDTSMALYPGYQDFTHISSSNGNIKLPWIYQSGSTIFPANFRWCYDCSETVSGRLYLDSLGDCTDASDPAFPAQLLSIDNGMHYLFTNINGDYLAFLDSGPHTIEPVVQNYSFWYSPCVSIPLNVNAPASPNVSTGNDMPLSLLPNVHEIEIYVSGSTPNPGFSTSATVVVKNNGTVPESGIVEYWYTDSIFDFTSATPAPDSISTGYLSWNYYNIPIYGINNYSIEFQVPTSVSLGYQFDLFGKAGDVTIDTLPINNTSIHNGVVTGSYDPNDKQVWPKGTGPEGYITPQDSLLEYLVRFQNTGTDTALIVRIEDMIDEDLDLATLQIGIASHPYTVQLNGRKLIFTFDNIMLPDSGANFAASNGLIQYFIEQKPGLTIGTEIKNIAAIYFDFNAPIITNMVTNTIDWATGVEEPITNLNGNKLVVYPNPFGENIELLWNINPEESVISSTLYSIQGQMLADLSSIFKTHSGKTDISWATSALPPGIYILKTTFTSENQILRIIKF